MAPTVKHYRAHHKMIKAIEKCSLQATFGPEVLSTEELLPKYSEVSSAVILKTSRSNDIEPVGKGTHFNKIPFPSAKPPINVNVLSIDPTKDSNIVSDRITDNHYVPADSTDRDGSIAAVVVNNDGMIPFQQSNFLGLVPLEIRGQKVSHSTFT